MPDHEYPTIQQKTSPPPGLVPKNAQSLILGGIALLMTLVFLFSNYQGTKAPKTAPAAPQPSPSDQARIKEYENRIEEQVRRVQAEQAELAKKRREFERTSARSEDGIGLFHGSPESRRTGMEGSATLPAPPSPLELERKKREYDSLFSSNVAKSRRMQTKSTPAEQQKADPANLISILAKLGALQEASSQTSLRRELGAASVATPTEPQPHTQAAPIKKQPDADDTIPRYPIYEGTVLETVLTNRLDGAFSGPVNCMVTANVYSPNRLHLLIPQGARVLGEAKRVESFGQQRLAVMFHRLILPNGDSISLDQLLGLDQVGATGLRDKVNHHYLQTFGASMAIGSIAGLGQANTRYGTNVSAGDAYRQGVAANLSQTSMQILDRYLNVLPTFTIREGKRVKIYLSQDLLLPEYRKHLSAIAPGELP